MTVGAVKTKEARDWASSQKTGRKLPPEEQGMRDDETRIYDHNTREERWLISH